jgi:prepilin-type N-terminal cleavage/methylation domain-containing protein/prepilin-type processing-associated H-X9-DG protein
MSVRPARQGFTIVELLVVISIIAMLSAILLPAVNSARSAARQMACIQNQGQIGKAMSQYAATKGKLPSYMSPYTPSWGGTYAAGWVYHILPQIDKSSIRDALQRSQNPGGTTGFDQLPDGYLQVLVCPDDSFTTDPALGPTSYAVNGGLSDHPTTPSPDWRDNGALGRTFVNAGQTPLRNTIDFVSSHDGVSTTIMVAENINFGTLDGTRYQRASWLPREIPSNTVAKEFELSQVVLWNGDPSITDVSFPGYTTNLINDRNDRPEWIATVTPSSTHAGGFVVTFCDGHTQFMSDLVDYTVYARAMTSNGANARLPQQALADITGSQGVITPNPPWQLVPITERDLQP